MDIVQILNQASEDPRFRPALQAAQAELADMSPEQVRKLISLLEMMIQQPQNYAALLASSVREGLVEEGDLPAQFDATLLASALVVLYKLRSGEGREARMARGGLTNLRTMAARGRMGDTMLAHINPEEAAMLKARGGAGTINPETGLPQYFSLKKALGVILPIAVSFIAPTLAPAIGSALLGAGASATATAALGSAVIGGLSAGLTGGDPLKGAVLGGLGGGLGSAVGSTASNALGLGLNQTAQNLLGGALVGGVAGAATGQGFGKGALMGAAGAGLGALGQAAGAAVPGAVGAGLGAGTQMAGNMLTAGYKPREAITGGALAGLATGIMQPSPGGQRSLRPSEQVVEGLRAPAPEGAQAPGLSRSFITGEANVTPGSALDLGVSAPEPGGITVPAGTAMGAPRPTPGSGALGGMKMGNVLGALSLAGAVMPQRPPAVDAAINQLSESQKEYFNRPSISWDWNKLQTDAAAMNMGLAQFMATQWPRITSGAYNQQMASAPQQQPVAMANGGLSAMARFARGAGSGRDDTIHARLSDGEYVMDAETVAMLGDGSTAEGARRLDAMRANLRRHKGKVLAKGKFSPNAKSPLAYLSGAAR